MYELKTALPLMCIKWCFAGTRKVIHLLDIKLEEHLLAFFLGLAREASIYDKSRGLIDLVALPMMHQAEAQFLIKTDTVVGFYYSL